MTDTKPRELAGIELAGRELLSASIEVKQQPDPQGKGFVNLTLSFHRPQLESAKGDRAVRAFVLAVEATCKAWSGELQGGAKEPSDEQLLMVCQLKVAARYRVARDGLSEKEVSDFNWYYNPQLTLLATDCLRTLLKDTRYSSIPIGLPTTSDLHE